MPIIHSNCLDVVPPKYIVPALRRGRESQNIHEIIQSNRKRSGDDNNSKSDNFGRRLTSSVLRFGDLLCEIVPQDEVDPCFRTPCSNWTIVDYT